MRRLEAELTWYEGELRPGVQVEIGSDGMISRVGLGLGEPTERLERQVLLPGMVNAHSHAFQRSLRGLAESFGEEGANFWSWREEMYRLVDRMDPESFRRSSVLAFREMLSAGITTVGEFHYLHHAAGSRGYELDQALLEAAREAGIRLVLLNVLYMTGDIGRELDGSQARFGSSSVDEFLEATERLERRMDSTRETLGLVAHSLRAVPIEAVAELHQYGSNRGLVFHMHVEEQEREIASAQAYYRKRPLELLCNRLDLGEEFTAVHCTHSRASDLEELHRAGANVCICPLTEANLADGVPPETLVAETSYLSLGTDSNLRIDFNEEMRLLEYAQRLRRQKRGLFRAEDGSVARRLFEIATTGGARSLGRPLGRLAPGHCADLVSMSLDAPALAGLGDADPLGAFVFGGDARAIDRVAVGGEWLFVSEREG